MSRLTRDGTTNPVSRDQIPRHARGQGNIPFPCSADHEQDWRPYPLDPYSAICDNQKRCVKLPPRPLGLCRVFSAIYLSIFKTSPRIIGPLASIIHDAVTMGQVQVKATFERKRYIMISHILRQFHPWSSSRPPVLPCHSSTREIGAAVFISSSADSADAMVRPMS